MTTDRPVGAQPFDKARFWRLLGQYFVGVAIGCLLVGVILNLKKWYLPPRPAPTPATRAPSGQLPPQPEIPKAPGTTPETTPSGPAK